MSSFVSSLEDDLSCSVCCDIFREPVLLSCGHSFCRECLSCHWSSSRGRRCPVCRRRSPREPLVNISLRSTCESFLQQQQQQDAMEAQRRRGKKMEEEEVEEDKEEEKDKKEEPEREGLCPQHGQELVFFCEAEEEPVCSECKRTEHRGHNVLTVHTAVKKRKGQLAAATGPLRERLVALRNGSPARLTAVEHIKAVVEKCERQIQIDFEKLFTFLKEEQKARLKAVRDAGIRETQQAKEAIEAEVTLLSNRVQNAEKLAEKNDIAFLQEFDAIMMSTQLSPPESAQCPWAMIDVPGQIGNLRFNVWQKMKDVAPYYPVILNPNTPLVGVTLSDDLTSVTATPQAAPDPFSPLSDAYALVLGSEAFNDCHAWDVHLGDSSDWMVGVTSRWPVDSRPFSLSPQGGFWAIQRGQNQYTALTSPPTPLKLPSSSPLKVLRVKLLWTVGRHGEYKGCRVRKVTFSNAEDSQMFDIFSFMLEGHKGALYPFLCPCGRGAQLRIEAAEVKVKVKEALGLRERYGFEATIVALYGIAIIVIFYVCNLCNAAQK